MKLAEAIKKVGGVVAPEADIDEIAAGALVIGGEHCGVRLVRGQPAALVVGSSVAEGIADGDDNAMAVLAGGVGMVLFVRALSDDMRDALADGKVPGVLGSASIVSKWSIAEYASRSGVFTREAALRGMRVEPKWVGKVLSTIGPASTIDDVISVAIETMIDMSSSSRGAC